MMRTGLPSRDIDPGLQGTIGKPVAVAGDEWIEISAHFPSGEALLLNIQKSRAGIKTFYNRRVPGLCSG
jgi:hypothetical protein